MEPDLRSAFDATSAGMLLVGLDGTILEANAAYCALVGRQRDAVIGYDSLAFTHPDDRWLTTRSRQRTLDASDPVDETAFEKRYERPDGEIIWVEVSQALVRSDTGEPAYYVVSVRDTTHVHRMTEALAEAEMHFRLAFESNTAPMAVLDAGRHVMRANDACCRMAGRTVDDLVGRDILDLTHPDDRPATVRNYRMLSAREVDRVFYTKRFERADGSLIWAEVAVDLLPQGPDAPDLYLVSIRDVTEEHRLQSKLSHQSLHDPLTGLATRPLFEDRLAQALSRARRSGETVAVMLLDIDDLGLVNGAWGHRAGDELLLSVAGRLARAVPDPSGLGRFGGDEFLYLAEEVDGAAGAEEIAAGMLHALGDPFTVGEASLIVGASIGIVVCDGGEVESHVDLVRDADSAMHQAKRLGKGRSVIFSRALHEVQRSRFALEQDLRHALERDELTMHYQPVVDLAHGRVVGFEALMRWRHPQRGWVSPVTFIPLAEQSDLIVDLGAYALATALHDLARWPTVPAGPGLGRRPKGTGTARPVAELEPASPLSVSVNLAARQMHDPGLIGMVKALLAETGVTGDRLVLEVTETAALSNVDSSQRLVEEVAELGVCFALDDFGTGYSSFSYLALLRPDVIKIDRSFVVGASDSSYDEGLLEAIVALGHGLGITVLAEGIETEEQADRLRGLHCELAQGYLFARPMPAGEIPAWLEGAARR
ncbi:MAG: EAL domain-containing protein [Actinomycetota bacterium]|nr:EAL domain-containing protein [Actinomycetota bacterium]